MHATQLQEQTEVSPMQHWPQEQLLDPGKGGYVLV